MWSPAARCFETCPTAGLTAGKQAAGLPTGLVVCLSRFRRRWPARFGLRRLQTVPLLSPGTKHATRNKWMRVALNGVKAAEARPRCGSRSQGRDALPEEDLPRAPAAVRSAIRCDVDTVRITWPNGLIQNEMKQPANQAHQLQGSAAPLRLLPDDLDLERTRIPVHHRRARASRRSARARATATYFPVDHDEYVQIPGEALAARDGQYEIRITEELSEVAYLDQIQLIAVDHPSDVEILTNDKFKGPPFPEFRLFGVAEDGAKARVGLTSLLGSARPPLSRQLPARTTRASPSCILSTSTSAGRAAGNNAPSWS